MSEWWTYSPSDFLLFSARTYYRLFELYNADIWPLQIPLLGLGAAIAAMVWRADATRGRIIAAILAGCWIWVAWGFHWQRYATINWAAAYFAAAFAAEALLLIWTGVIRSAFELDTRLAVPQRIGIGVFLFALLVQPLIGPLVGREWAQMEVFGAAPDPTALATLGILLAARRMSWGLLIIPLLWCALSGIVLWTMGSPDAPVMLLAAPAVLIVAVCGMVADRPGAGVH